VEEDERLEGLSRIYGLFNGFQITTLIIGSLMAGMAPVYSQCVFPTLVLYLTQALIDLS